MKKLILCTFLISFGVFAQTLPTITEQGNQKILKYPDGRTVIISDRGIVACNGDENCNYLSPQKWGHDNLLFENMGSNTIRVTGMGQIAGDYKLVSADDQNAVIDISSPNYPDKNARAYITNKRENEGEIVIKDTKTGETLISGAAKKTGTSEYLNIKNNVPGREESLYYNVTGKEGKETGTFTYSYQEGSGNLQLNNGVPTGTICQMENGYERIINMYADGKMKVIINDPKTHKMLYTAYGTEENMKLYDANGKLIAEGNEDDMKIYDKNAYQQYEKITDDD